MRAGASRSYSLLAAVLVLFWTAPIMDHAQSQDERAVRAAYVFNLTKFVEWPPEKQELIIGFLGSRETGEFFYRILDGKKSESRSIHFHLFPTADELAKCDVVYVGEGQPSAMRTIVYKLAENRTLTIGESDAFIDEGGMVALVKNGQHIQMHVNTEATQRAGVRLASPILNMAVIVGGKGPASRGARRILRRTEPPYPPLAEKIALHGIVRLKLRVSADGAVQSVECLGGHPLLAQAATTTAKEWKFEPREGETTEIAEVKF